MKVDIDKIINDTFIKKYLLQLLNSDFSLIYFIIDFVVNILYYSNTSYFYKNSGIADRINFRLKNNKKLKNFQFSYKKINIIDILFNILNTKKEYNPKHGYYYFNTKTNTHINYIIHKSKKIYW